MTGRERRRREPAGDDPGRGARPGRRDPRGAPGADPWAGLLDELPDVCLRLAPDDRIVAVAGGRRADGSRPPFLVDDAAGRYVWALFDGEAANAVRRAAALARRGQPVTTEIALPGPGGLEHHEVRHLPLPDGGQLVLVRDVTALVRARERQQRSEARLRDLLLHTPALLATLAPDGTVETANDRLLERLGYGADEMVGRHWTDFVGPGTDDRRAADAVAERLAADGACRDLPLRLRTKGGEAVDVLVSVRSERDEAGAPVRLHVTLSDVSAQRAAERALAERERELATLVANLPGMVYRCRNDRDWTMLLVSDGVRDLTGYGPAEVVDSAVVRWGDLIHPDDREAVWDGTETALARREPWTLTYRLVARDGTVKVVWDRGRGVWDSDGRLLWLEGFLQDVTAAHEAERALAAARDRLKLQQAIDDAFLTAEGEEAFVDALEAVRTAVGARWGFFGYLDDDGSLVAPSLTHEVWDACRVEGKSLRFPPETWGDNTWSRALRSGRTQVLEGPGRVPAGHVAVDNAVAVPVVSHGQTIGLFILAGREAPFGDADVALLDGLAAYVAPILRAWRERLWEERARTRSEAALAESEARYRALFEQAPVGTLVFDASLVVSECNAAFAEIMGVRQEDLVGLDMARLRDQRPIAAFRRALQGETAVYEGEYVSTLAGRHLHVTVKATPRRDADGRVVGGIAVVVDRTAEHAAEQERQRLLLYDVATGLPNRTLFLDRLSQACAHAARKRLTLAVATLQLDRFEALAASLGHEAAEAVLRSAGERLQGVLREEDTPAHLGGGEFALLLPGVGGPGEARAVVDKVRAALAEPLRVDGREVFASASLGLAVYPTDGHRAADLLADAETAMHRAARSGGDQWQFFHVSMNAERDARLRLEAELHHALERDEFFLEYQPIVAADGRLVAVESLVRWRHPERGVVPPLEFIPVAEDCGLMAGIGAWVLREACRQGRAWQKRTGAPLRVAVNVSACQLHREDLVATVREALRETRFDPASLELEVTETAAMRDPRHTAVVLTALRAMGVRVALDDFGTGYSSLSHLVRLPVSTVKIDRSFVRDLLNVPEHHAVAAAVIALGHRLGLTVVAEGVETPGERSVLADEGCDCFQGYLFSRPLPAAACEELVRRGRLEPAPAATG